MMGILDELRGLSAAEDFFRTLGVKYDAEVLNVARLHILRRMGTYLSQAELEPDEDAARAQCRAQLQRAYDDFTRSTPIAERVFKVHRDAVRPSGGFVSLSELTQDGT
ncbi:nitrogen fixation protein NifW [Gluconacetobacter diazotrophicus PA1 5]|uniref:Nitrogenase-stabilizing/protective protein NifW n=2 Tax=Gluconacetobacter diazotrophicus TaxID=33996 RepID=NIFW_GLUDA|nr:nitrogenase stabilizing/protective protein NifW [Gluconacetobacter diazotrophicus]Q9FA11.1 RecName: Full=Nitrogenase-stabilizing/protective protein NifW [Gluconacetobacter diazotrophicus PA1 5]AAG27076.1 NifW [Gluconacetobacter diazotrophicus PA1 5]ACI51335.1 nitrogen fixation protein NifW [Gluconacetobacter diazotrophicus PA1 5]MBB2157420.1 nitrogenase stabilizing/protective protein NifW [Gluconacetobacter diazotrophicus]TWB09883.1 nitrogenase-stabilizing/protective protein [Gluconacetobac